MATVRYSIRQKKWIVTWKSHGTSLRHECDSEQAALTFSQIQETIFRKELLLRSPKRQRKSISVRELFDRHFLRCTKSRLTIKQDMYHAKPLLDFFARKMSSSINRALRRFVPNKSEMVRRNPQFTDEFRCFDLSSAGVYRKVFFPLSWNNGMFQREKGEGILRRQPRSYRLCFV